MSDKPFKGVIRAWYLYNNRVHGICVIYDGGIEDGNNITTSNVVGMSQIKDSTAKMCETKNSRYLLI